MQELEEENKDLMEQLVDVLDRNYDTYEIESNFYKSYDVLNFKMRRGFHSTDLKGIFNYVKSDMNKIYEWHVDANSWNTVLVSIFLRKEGGYI